MTAALKLYEWTDAMARVEELLYESEGELTPEIEAELERVTEGFETKAEAVALYVRGLIASASAVKLEESRLAARRQRFERSAENLKGYLQAQMEAAGIPKVEGKLVTVRLQKSPPSVVIDREVNAETYACFPKFVTLVPEQWKLDAKAVIEAAKSGGEIPEGVRVVQNTHLRIA